MRAVTHATVATRFRINPVLSNAKRLERFERLERLEPFGSYVFMGELDQRAEGNRKVTVSD
jgi:hypothetical protein